MIIEQIYTGCLSQGAYYIESNGDAAIIDPLREVAPYIEKAKKNKAAIKYIFETHFHADFVSGHVTLAKETGATIVYGPEAKTSYDSLIAKDHQEFKIGNITLTVLHTPGHTMESTTYLLRDQNEKEIAIFSGDTLFLGDVGRPDLAQKAANISQEELAGILYESLWEKIMPLPDDVLIYPAHGAGSACGKNLSKETVGTLGEQKRKNYALREDMTKEEFISEVTKDLLPAPQYFPLNVKMNMEGYKHIDTVLESGTKSLSLNEFEAIANENEAIILDVRHQNEFAKGHIPKSIFIGIDGGFAPWAGSIIGNISQPILLVTPKGREKETVTRLARVGFDNTLGYLEGGTEIWDKAGKNLDSVNSVDTDALKQLMERDNIKIFDVRKPQEYQSEHVTNAFSTPLDFINEHLSEFPSNLPFYIHCAGGYRSMIAASILKRMEIHNIIDIKGGFTKIKEAGIEVSN
ncbi:MAG: rhodanese-like domain-containing protein [Flavobacteriaceae bacterium]|nr:MBL fold metallo-hydrolase [Flavobacteriaceae bacterium]MDG2062605.1 rhodanese-like domain-containing protein [Flavobacteriaceae bacterium]|tara:strand:- start:42 stop:1430 length:1389 start_codon:yes stop_codon:yes gene_type:complete